ncbi:MAG: S8 family serine peptidase [Calditrichia bacterium]
MRLLRGVIPLLTTAFASGLYAQPAEISVRMDLALQDAAQANSTIKAYVMLNDQVDVTSLDQQLYTEKASLKDRVYIVLTALREKADETQYRLLNRLADLPADQVPNVTSLWIVNMLLIEAKAEVYYELMKHGDVAIMDVVPEPNWDRPVAEGPASASIPGGVEPGIEAINARKMWEQGYDGTGRLVMGIDSGVNGNHPAVAGKWRGNSVPASEAWLGSGSFPNDCDGGSHGTHTIGTMTGFDPVTADTIGVAPGAEWIASGALCGNVTRIQAFQWALDPDNNPATTSDMPDAIGCSWWDPNGGVCASNIYINVLNTLEAAGIAVIFSAGNSGPGTSTITRPKNTNTTLVNFWATGALNGNDPNLTIANFSSRGPSTCGSTGSLLIKPEASAPGVAVRSATGTSGYGTKNGTSMAAPHVVGAIALLRQAFPNKTGYELKLALYNTARDLGVPGEDNDYGMGIIDVWAAFLSMAGPLAAENFTAYSDYLNPTEIQLSWIDPELAASGDSLVSGAYTMLLYRDGELLDSVASDVETFLDTGLTSGTSYRYSLRAVVDSLGVLGDIATTQWTAGGARQPSMAVDFEVAGHPGFVEMTWKNPSTNIDGTPLVDFAGINIYRDGELYGSLARSTSDTSASEYTNFTPTESGYYTYHISAFDDETPTNESPPSPVLTTPRVAPLGDQLSLAGIPNPALWRSFNVEINDRAVGPGGSATYAVNLNGTPFGTDTLELRPTDTRFLDNQNASISFRYQPQGSGNAPEQDDSLRVYFKNDLGEWYMVSGYAGSTVVPFVQEIISLDSVDTGAGSIFHENFQVRFVSRGGAGNFPNDNWFLNTFYISGPPTGIDNPDEAAPLRFMVSANYPNPFNPSTTIDFQLPQRSDVELTIFNTLGQKIRSLVTGSVAAGTHSVIWNGQDESGQGVASGIYIYRFTSGDYQRINKMILMK